MTSKPHQQKTNSKVLLKTEENIEAAVKFFNDIKSQIPCRMAIVAQMSAPSATSTLEIETT
jgi:hypothetical protein